VILRFPFRRRPHPPNPEDRALGAYLGVAIGDALGAAVEFMTPSEIDARCGIHRQIRGGGWLHLKRGAVTDDTQMTLALGEAILAAGGQVDARIVAEAFSAWMRSKPADIGHTVRRGLVAFRQTGKTEMPESESAAGNGACMRTLPIALALLGRDAPTVREASRRQAHITHNNAMSDAGTECVIAMVQLLVAGRDGREALAHLALDLATRFPAFRFDGRRQENPSGYIVHTLQAVFQAVLGNATFEETLVDVVNRGGDADTTGAIAGMIAGALYGRNAIPRRWLRQLDKNVRRTCEAQAHALLKLSPVGAARPAAESVQPPHPPARLLTATR